mgnify:CR=1 FL=1
MDSIAKMLTNQGCTWLDVVGAWVTFRQLVMIRFQASANISRDERCCQILDVDGNPVTISQATSYVVPVFAFGCDERYTVLGYNVMMTGGVEETGEVILNTMMAHDSLRVVASSNQDYTPAGGADTCWNGNISEWQQENDVTLMYGFAYDGVNRLLETMQKQKSGTAWSTLVGSYVYDKNGNTINDSRRALNLSYNVLNLLSEVKTASGELKARCDYLADGTKLRVRDADGNWSCVAPRLEKYLNNGNESYKLFNTYLQ